MNRKEALLAAVGAAVREGSILEKSISENERQSSGTFERWAPKDGISHVADWLARDLDDISSGSTVEAATTETIEAINKDVFSLHAGKTWDESMDFFRSTYEKCRSLVAGMDDAELDREVGRSDGTSRSVWRMIAGHALMHASSHYSMIYDRAGQPEKGTSFEQEVSRIITDIDDSPEWTATAKYNLACRYSLTGDADKAISLLAEVFAVSEHLKEWAGKDEDLDPLRDLPEFRDLTS